MDGPVASLPVRLTSFSHGAGCGCKLSPDDLATVLGQLRAPSPHGVDDPRLLVGFGTNDDAAVFLLRDDLAVVFTTDFFTPIVDDPFDWGRIAATNAVSDIYAMGATPILALNLVAWPRERLPLEMLARVLDGGAMSAAENGYLIAGGHSIDDPEPKYGLAVIGTVHPDRLLTNAGGRAGDVLILTKPIGLGVVTTAAKRDLASDDQLRAAIDLMTISNAVAAGVVADAGPAVHALTDVTGFGLAGHLRELALASGLAASVDLGALPEVAGARALISRGVASGGARRNCEFVSRWADWDACSDVDRLLLCDPQTSGGLLVACAPDHAPTLTAGLDRAGVPCARVIGELVEGGPGALHVRRTTDR